MLQTQLNGEGRLSHATVSQHHQLVQHHSTCHDDGGGEIAEAEGRRDRGMEGEERGGSATRLEVMSRGVDKTSSRAERMESEERGGGGLREVRAVTSNCRAREEFSSSKSSSRTIAEQ